MSLDRLREDWLKKVYARAAAHKVYAAAQEEWHMAMRQEDEALRALKEQKMDFMSDRVWRCRECEELALASELIVVPNPFDNNITITVCPHCKERVAMHKACEVVGCRERCTYGLPTSQGYNLVCRKHYDEIKREDEGETEKMKTETETRMLESAELRRAAWAAAREANKVAEALMVAARGEAQSNEIETKGSSNEY